MVVVFDVLYADGADLRLRRWTERREMLERLLDGAAGAVRTTPGLTNDPALHDALVADGSEGTVATREAGRYVSGRRSAAWMKIKSAAARDRDRLRVAGAA